MSPQNAIAQSRIAFQKPEARWPATLIAYLTSALDEKRAIDWLISCVEELLNCYGKATDELKESISMARKYAFEGGNVKPIEQRAQALWIRRSAEGEPITAVAQLLFALTQADRKQKSLSAGSFATPISLLERLEARRGDVFNQVVAHFLNYIDDDSGEGDE